MKTLDHVLRCLASGVFLVLAASPGLAPAQTVAPATPAAGKETANALNDLQVSQLADTTVIKVVLARPLAAVPASFTIAQPARVAFDFTGTANALKRGVQQVNQGDLRSINIVQVGERTRLVLNLNRMLPYETRLEGDNLIITLTAAPLAAAQAASTTFAAAQPQTATQARQSLRDINFRRGKEGEGRVLVSLPHANVGIDMQKQGKNLLVTFKKVGLPARFNQRLDVTDFATPLTSITTRVQGEDVLMTLSPHGLWEHNAYQSDDQFVVELRPLVEKPNELLQADKEGGAAQAKKLSLNFQSLDVRSVLQVIADFTDYNIITSDSVTGNVTLRLKDVPWDQALDIVLQSKGLGMRKNGNVIWVAPEKEIIARDEYQARSRLAMSVAEPMQTETFHLSFAKAEEVAALLAGEGAKRSAAKAEPKGEPEAASKASEQSAAERGNYISSYGTVTMDARTNQLFVTDYPRYLERVKQLISQIDKPVKQVLIEARIVSAEDNFGRSLGVRLGYNDLSSTIPGRGVGHKIAGSGSDATYAQIGGSIEAVHAQTGQATGGGVASGTAPTVAQNLFVNLPAISQGGAAPSKFAISLFKNGLSGFINMELQAAETDGRVKGIASPRVVTANAQQAEIIQGVEIPYIKSAQAGATPTTEFKKAALKLAVTPQITADGSVILDLEVSNDEVGAILRDGVAINTKGIKTKVTVENGGTVVLGGVYQQNEMQTDNKVPLLGDIPILGYLFKSSTRTQARKELLVFITPKIIEDQVQAAIR